MVTFNFALDTVMQLRQEERDDLIEIIKKRQTEQWRKDTAEYYYELKNSLTRDDIKSLSANEAIVELHNYLNSPE